MSDKLKLLIIFFALTQTSFAQARATHFINPTGTYKLVSKTVTKNGETYGYFGEINVKLLENTKIAITLYVCKGALSYNSGSFLDTLNYQKNIAV